MRLFRCLLAAVLAMFLASFRFLAGAPARRAVLCVAILFLVFQLAAPHAYAANDGFDPSVSWSDWFWHYSGVVIQTVYGWFGKCMPDITGTACQVP